MPNSSRTSSLFGVNVVGRDSLDRLAPGLSELDRRVRQRLLPSSYWRWLYFENPAGDAAAFVAASGEQTVGRLERIPIRVTVDGRELVAELLQGLTLLPEFRQWSHLRQLVLAAVQAARDPNESFAFGFATEWGSKLHASLGGPVLGCVPIFAGVVDGSAALRDRGVPVALSPLAGPPLRCVAGIRRANPDPGIDIAEIQEFGPEFDGLWNELRPEQGVAVIKDARYLNWRYAACPVEGYRRLAARKNGRLAGYLTWRKSASTSDAHILDVCAQDPQILAALLDAAEDQMRADHVGLVTACCPQRGTTGTALRQAGYGAWATTRWNMHLIVTPRAQAPNPELAFPSWNYSLGDWLYH